MGRQPSQFNPDTSIEGVAPRDMVDNCIENRHIGPEEITPDKMDNVKDNVGTPLVVHYEVTEGAAEISIFNGNAPFKFEVLEVTVQCRNASANGTIKVTDGTNDITEAIACAVDKTVTRASTIDDAYSTIAASGSLKFVATGDVVVNTKGLVTIIGIKKL